MISANRLPPTFLNMRLGTSVARFGSPVPRYMSRKPSLSKSPKLLPIVAKTMSRPASLVLSSKPLPLQVVEEPVGIPAVRLADQALDHVVERCGRSRWRRCRASRRCRSPRPSTRSPCCGPSMPIDSVTSVKVPSRLL